MPVDVAHAKPMRMNERPMAAAIPATPYATMDMNSEARRNDAFIADARRGSSRGSWA